MSQGVSMSYRSPSALHFLPLVRFWTAWTRSELRPKHYSVRTQMCGGTLSLSPLVQPSQFFSAIAVTATANALF